MLAQTIVFDVNETLLDLAALDPLFETHLGSAQWRRAWFSDMLVTAMTLNHIGKYYSFSDIARVCLDDTASVAGARLKQSAIEEILNRMRTLPPHADVIPALEILSRAGLRLVALTNSAPDTAASQLESAGLSKYLGGFMTVAEARRLKPAREVYAAAREWLGTDSGALMLVAAHTWDLAGAAKAGWKTGFVSRDNRLSNPLYPKPTLADTTLTGLAERIVA